MKQRNDASNLKRYFIVQSADQPAYKCVERIIKLSLFSLDFKYNDHFDCLTIKKKVTVRAIMSLGKAMLHYLERLA